MEPDNKPARKRAGRKPPRVLRLDNKEFSSRRVYSRQNDNMKAAVRRVVVDGVDVTDVAKDLGHSRQNVHDGIVRFLTTTAAPMQRMAPREFAYAARLRRNPRLVQAARLYLVEGYSVPEASKEAGTSGMQVKALVKSMRRAIRRVDGILPPPSKGEVYNGPRPDWQWPTAQEMGDVAASCLVRQLSKMTYSRAYMVLVLKMSPSEVAKLTKGTLQFLLYSVDSVVAQLDQYRLHRHFPKDANYLSDLSRAMDAKSFKPAIRCAIEDYLVHGVDLDVAASNAKLDDDVVLTRDALFRAVRTTIHQMARMRKHQ